MQLVDKESWGEKETTTSSNFKQDLFIEASDINIQKFEITFICLDDNIFFVRVAAPPVMPEVNAFHFFQKSHKIWPTVQQGVG